MKANRYGGRAARHRNGFECQSLVGKRRSNDRVENLNTNIFNSLLVYYTTISTDSNDKRVKSIKAAVERIEESKDDNTITNIRRGDDIKNFFVPFEKESNGYDKWPDENLEQRMCLQNSLNDLSLFQMFLVFNILIQFFVDHSSQGNNKKAVDEICSYIDNTSTQHCDVYYEMLAYENC